MSVGAGEVGVPTSIPDATGYVFSVRSGAGPRFSSFPNPIIGYIIVPMHARSCFGASTAHSVVVSAGHLVAILSSPGSALAVSRALLASLATPVDVHTRHVVPLPDILGSRAAGVPHVGFSADPSVVLPSLIHLVGLVRSGWELWWCSFPTALALWCMP